MQIEMKNRKNKNYYILINQNMKKIEIILKILNRIISNKIILNKII